MIRVQLVNQSAILSARDAKDLATGLTKYSRLVSQAWHMEQFSVSTQPYGADDWKFYVVDEFPAGAPQNALGYHAEQDDGTIVAYISASETMKPYPSPMPDGSTRQSPFGTIIDGVPTTGTIPGTPDLLWPGSLGEVLSHELAEAMVDASVNRLAVDWVNGRAWVMEVGDHADANRFVLTFGIRRVRMICQDFTLPSFYDNHGKAPFSYTGKVSAPFTIDKGAYGQWMPLAGFTTVGIDREDESDPRIRVVPALPTASLMLD